jgi:hypothetical protein
MRLTITPTIEIDLIPVKWNYAPESFGNTKGVGFKWLFIRVNFETKD